MSLETLSDLVFHIREISSGRPDLLAVRLRGRRETLSAADFLRGVHSLALALEARGLSRDDRIAIFSENRPEVHIVDFACQLLGAATVPLDPAWPGHQVGFVLRNSSSRWVFYDDAKKRDLLVGLESTLTSAPELAAFDGDAAAARGTSLTRLMGEGAERLGEVPIERFRGRVEGGDPASLLYHIDGTGNPEGVLHSHREQIADMLACDQLFALSPADLAVSSLALSCDVQRTVDHLCFYRGVAIRYVPAADELPETLRRERPSLLAAASAVYERSHQRTLKQIRLQGSLRRRLFHWGIAAGKRHAATMGRGGFVGPFLALERKLADWIVYRDVRRRFGGRLRYAVTGEELPPREIREFFEALGVPLVRGGSWRSDGRAPSRRLTSASEPPP